MGKYDTLNEQTRAYEARRQEQRMAKDDKGPIVREQPTIKRVEDLLEIHDDEKTTQVLNAKWRELREVVDGRASKEDTRIKGKLVIEIEYDATKDSGLHDISIKCDVKLPAERVVSRTMYEAADGSLTDRKPTKHPELFDNVVQIKKV